MGRTQCLHEYVTCVTDNMCLCVCACSGTHLSNDVRYLLLKVLETFLSYDTLHQIQSGCVSHLTWLVLPLPLGGVVHQVTLNLKKNDMYTNGF